jgi:palmitoyl-protein thioesterase
VYDCPLAYRIIPFVCELFKSDPYHFLFNGSIPLSFSDYFKTTDDEAKYLRENTYLPYINNEIRVNSTYKATITGLKRMSLIQALNDTVVYPHESEQFGGYVWGSNNTVFTLRESQAYAQDWLGLKTLDTSGRLHLDSYVGDHLRFSDEYWNTHILPLFNDPMAV